MYFADFLSDITSQLHIYNMIVQFLFSLHILVHVQKNNRHFYDELKVI